MKTNMVYVPLDWTSFCSWAGRRSLIRRGVFDEGFALHVLLANMFGKSELQPFRLFRPSRANTATLYAYSSRSQEALRDIAAAAAPPDCLPVVRVGNLLTKPIPTSFRKGQRLGFDVRIRPVRRLARDLRDSQSKTGLLRSGSEVDAYRLELLRKRLDGWRDAGRSATVLDGVSRQAVYVDWLAERLAGVADLDPSKCSLANFRRSRARRGKGRGPEGPDATLHGEFLVRNPAEFARKLQLGVGRHRAYGYGMLIIRPPNVRPQIS